MRHTSVPWSITLSARWSVLRSLEFMLINSGLLALHAMQHILWKGRLRLQGSKPVGPFRILSLKFQIWVLHLCVQVSQGANWLRSCWCSLPDACRDGVINAYSYVLSARGHVYDHGRSRCYGQIVISCSQTRWIWHCSGASATSATRMLRPSWTRSVVTEAIVSSVHCCGC